MAVFSAFPDFWEKAENVCDLKEVGIQFLIKNIADINVFLNKPLTKH